MIGDIPYNFVSKPTDERVASRTTDGGSLDRLVLEHIDDVAYGTTLDELAVGLAADDRLSDVDAERSLRIRLHHVVLPLLQETGLVRYDPITHRIERDTDR